jgi:hypothetical protein
MTNRWRYLFMSINPIESAFHELISLLKETKTDYLLIGGLAVLASGQPRMTQDIDLILFIEKTGLPAFLKIPHSLKLGDSDWLFTTH